MKKLVILGAGTAGTMMANHLSGKLPAGWEIILIDQDNKHYYQPGLLFLPFGIYDPDDIIRPRNKYLPSSATYVERVIDRIDAEDRKVYLEGGMVFHYDLLIIATGSRTEPGEIPGILGPLWNKKIFDFYTYEGSLALRNALDKWEGGNLVVHVTEMPIKCPVAPLEFAFLADSYFRNKGMRNKVKISFVTPLGEAFTKPRAANALGHLLKQKNIELVTDFGIMEADNEKSCIRSYEGNEVPFDLLVTIPTNMGDPCIERSGLGDDLRFIPTHKDTLQSKQYPDIFVIGDATDIPASKAGSVAHFEAEVLTENILHHIKGEPLKASFDGHANCFIETGNNKAVLIDFNYVQEPVEGTFPIPGIGPLSLLKESRVNHMGKLAFKWVYWNMLLKGRPIPFVSANMSTKGKKLEPTA